MPGFFDVLKQPPVEYPGGDYPLFTRISIEPISFCNRACGFCPVSWTDRARFSMAPALFDKIVAELGALSFDGVAQLFLLSEPMIDRTLPDKARALRAACPNVSIYLSSNGDVLDALLRSRGLEAALSRLEDHYAAGVNVINLNVYDDAEQLNRFTAFQQEVYLQRYARPTEHKYRHHNPRGRYLCVTDMRPNRETAKGTDQFYIKNRETMAARTEAVPQRHCSRTQRHLVVRADGKVPVCCAIDINQDDLVIGDVNTSTLLEVWNSEAFFKYRWYTQRAMRVLPGCDTCTHRMAFPHVVRKVIPDTATADRWEEERRA